jgi:hypothetical protein
MTTSAASLLSYDVFVSDGSPASSTLISGNRAPFWSMRHLTRDQIEKVGGWIE